MTDKKSSTTYIYENNSSNKLTKYRVDGCLIDDHNSKCDFLLLNCDKKESYFVELKGSDLIKAVEQIDRSIDLLHSKFKDFSVNGRIVLTRVNTTDLKNSKLIRLEQKIKRLNGNLKKQNRQMTEVN
ncbi:hypothetical protein [Flavobacterium sp. WV_118_3]|uniref:hypothetical protein n=1 Tax=Flavobacterium sp. WV_118_3 TaxID=3151764 RepID=UPI00321ADD37